MNGATLTASPLATSPLTTSPRATSPQLLAGQPAQMSAAEMAKRGQIKATAEKFESSFLSVMFEQMFDGVDTSAPFGGGEGEAMFKSFLTDAMAKQVAKRGGIGVADTVTREMLKLQGLQP